VLAVACQWSEVARFAGFDQPGARLSKVLGPLEEVRRRRLIIHRLDAWPYAEIRPYLGRRVLEVGSGHGNFIQHLLDRDLVVATDVEPCRGPAGARASGHDL
jgi:hypothetical protein